jgi:chitodextrinase
MKHIKKLKLHTGSNFSPNYFLSKSNLLVFALLFAGIGGFAVLNSFAAVNGVLSLSPSTSNVALGSNFTVTINADSTTTPVNAVETDLTFPTDKLQFVSVDTTTSAYGVAAVATGDNTNGTVTIGRGASGGTTLTGVQQVAKVTFKALAPGSAVVSFANSSALVESATNTDIVGTKNNGTYSITDSAAPTVPTGLTVGTRTVNSVAFTWTASTDNVAVTGYRIFRNGTQINTSATTSFTDTGLTPNTNYSYTVAAFDASGNASAQSAALATSTLADTVAPSVPSGLTVGTRTVNSIAFTWTASTDNIAVTGYRIFRNGTQINTSTGTSYTDTGLAANTTYSYTVAAVDAVPNVSAQSAALAATTLADTTAPSVPTGLQVTNQIDTGVVLKWTASTDNIAVTGYRIFRNGVQVGTSTGTTFTDTTGITAGNIYNYSVAAVDAVPNISAQTATLAVTVYKTGDINRDNIVNVFDLSILLSNYNKTRTQASNPLSDINNDNIVDIFDLGILLTKYGL